LVGAKGFSPKKPINLEFYSRIFSKKLEVRISIRPYKTLKSLTAIKRSLYDNY